jgi:hypothetical protein
LARVYFKSNNNKIKINLKILNIENRWIVNRINFKSYFFFFIKVENATWSEWSEWSECFSKQLCQPGIRVKKRNCLINNQIVASSKCTGMSYYTADCLDENCHRNETSFRRMNANLEWSECSNNCGTGLMTRPLACSYADNLDCSENNFEQKTCESYKNCSNQSMTV